MTRAQAAAASPWPLLVGGGALAGGALWWWHARQARASAAAASSPSPSSSPSPREAVAALLPPLIPPAVVDAMPPLTAAPLPPVAPGVPIAPIMSAPAAPPPPPPRSVVEVLGGLPFVPPAIAAAVAAGTWPGPVTPAPVTPAPVTPAPAAPVNGASGVAVAPASTLTAPAAEALPSAGWVYPLLRWGEYAPGISDGFGSIRDGGARRHHGVDVMYPRRGRADLVVDYPPRAPHSPLFFMPEGSVVVAAADGEIWSARRTSRGHAITLTHAGGWETFYQHLSQLFVPQLDHGTGKIRVVAGQALGFVGVDPTQGARALAHLHFELRRSTHPLDPRPAMAGWRVLAKPTQLPDAFTILTPPPAVRDPREAALLARLYATHGQGIPVAYLTALGLAESGGDAHHPRGVLNLTRVAVDGYNRAHPAAPVALVQLRQPEIAIPVAVWVLRQVIASYHRHHPETPNLQEDWANPEFAALVTAGWNAGYSEAAGVGYVARWLVAHGLPVTLANVFGYAARAGAAATLRDPNKRRFAERVLKLYQAAMGGRS